MRTREEERKFDLLEDFLLLFLGMGWRIGTNWIERKTWTEGCFFFIRLLLVKRREICKKMKCFISFSRDNLVPKEKEEIWVSQERL